MKFLIFFITFLVIISSIFAVIYFTVEKEAELRSIVNYTAINVAVYDNDTNMQIQSTIYAYTGFSNNLYTTINTTENYYTQLMFPQNSTVALFSVKNGYYTSSAIIDTMNSNITRLNIKMLKIGNLSVYTNNTLLLDSTIQLHLDKQGYVDLNSICFRWSTNIIKVLPFSLAKTNIDSRYVSKVDSCYNLMNYNDTVVYLKVMSNQLQSLDNIIVYILDNNYEIEKSSISVSSKNNSDIGISDIKYIIN